jgi:putative nucleotidyltransferase with HDIG domain
MLEQLQLNELVRNTSDLPSMPEHAFEVIRIANLSETSAADVARTLSKDPSLTARVLRLANSSFYGLSREVPSISDAVVVLGMRTVKSLALVAASFPWLQKALKGTSLCPELMWNHCLTVATVARLIARKKDYKDAEIAFCAALLHDMGEVVMCLWKEGDYTELVEAAEASNAPFDQIEREIFGFTHAEVGAALTRNWNLPEIYTQAIEFHHNPSDAGNDTTLADIIHVADLSVRDRGINEGLQHAFYLKDVAAFERVSIDPVLLDEMVTNAIREVNSSQDEEEEAA